MRKAIYKGDPSLPWHTPWMVGRQGTVNKTRIGVPSEDAFEFYPDTPVDGYEDVMPTDGIQRIACYEHELEWLAQ